MQTPMRAAVLAVLISCSSLAFAEGKQEARPAAAAPQPTPEQQAEMEAWAKMGAVRDEHKQLAYFAGNWAAKSSMWMDPAQPAQVSDAKAVAAAILGGRYIETHHEGSFMGQPYHGQGLLGFDNLKGKFFSTWVDGMSTGLWLAWGEYDAKTRTYTFRGEMDDPMKAGAKIPVRQMVRIADDKHYGFDWYETRGGKEVKTMQIEYTRQ